jgi:hypothetical protein
MPWSVRTAAARPLADTPEIPVESRRYMVFSANCAMLMARQLPNAAHVAAPR